MSLDIVYISSIYTWIGASGSRIIGPQLFPGLLSTSQSQLVLLNIVSVVKTKYVQIHYVKKMTFKFNEKFI